LLVLVSCTRNNPHKNQTEDDKRCLKSFEYLADFYLSDSTQNCTIQSEKWITVDPKHKLLKPVSIQLDFGYEFPGIKDYEDVIVVEINLFVRRGYEYSETLKKIYERHLLLVGDFEKFNPDQILWSDKEKIIKDEILSERSKLIITQKE
jgi:hypothetical protein